MRDRVMSVKGGEGREGEGKVQIITLFGMRIGVNKCYI